VNPPRLDQPFVDGTVLTPAGPIPRVSSRLGWPDRLGSWKARWAIGRMHYTVDPGLYALGNPDSTSCVFVSANYKMSFDVLRAALVGFDAWILVVDTKGINVWCAAGKGTFDSAEVARRVSTSRLPDIVSHRMLILPQLAASGVSAHELRERSGFKVVYGPVEAQDIGRFLKAGLKATPDMRTKDFPTVARLVLTPVELVRAFRIGIPVLAGLWVLSLFLTGLSWPRTFEHALVALLALLTSILAGAFFTPVLLPFIPGRAFSFKGFVAGLIGLGLIFLLRDRSTMSTLQTLTLVFWIPAATAYLAMNFTGCSTFTSLSGVRKEMRLALPLEVAGMALGLVAWIAGSLVER
jgi:hypothetical protein